MLSDEFGIVPRPAPAFTPSANHHIIKRAAPCLLLSFIALRKCVYHLTHLAFRCIPMLLPASSWPASSCLSSPPGGRKADSTRPADTIDGNIVESYVGRIGLLFATMNGCRRNVHLLASCCRQVGGLPMYIGCRYLPTYLTRPGGSYFSDCLDRTLYCTNVLKIIAKMGSSCGK